MRVKIFLTIITVLVLVGAADAQPPDRTPQKRLGVVATAHLDTQWRWTIKNTIDEFIPNTLHDNFRLLETYPDYVFSFEGAFRYMQMKEYYPEEYQRLKEYIAQGRWRVTGSWVDAVDVNLPSFESLVRHTLYGNGFYKKEFGKQSYDIFMPDCFGFGYALPSIANHCGLKSFSTQKLTWGCSVDIPFPIGYWRGVDGSAILSGIDPGSYGTRFDSDLSRDTLWAKKIEQLGASTGCYAGYAYFGTGDIGGAPESLSVDWLAKSIHSDGPIQVASIGADDLPLLVAEYPDANLPEFDGELVMTRHGVGCYTSQAAMKRWNRRNELLGDAAERAAVMASLLGGYDYPRETLREAWIRFLWHQFHDDITGTSIPEAYEFSWSDELLSLNQFANILTSAVSAVTPALDTRGKGRSFVVYNPLSIDREAPVAITIYSYSGMYNNVRVFSPDEIEVPSQTSMVGDDSVKIIFNVSVPSVGFAVYDIRPTETNYPIKDGVIVTDSTMENNRYLLTLNANGDVASIFDKTNNREMLSAPIEWQLIYNKPGQWPAWEIQYEDLLAGPRGIVEGTTRIEIVESGAVRGALRITRAHGNSTYITTIQMSAGDAGDRIDFINEVDWAETETLLKVAFKPTLTNDSVTYDLGLGTITRGVSTERKYEVPAHQFADFSSIDKSYGLTIMNDCKYGWDHPDSATLRLTLLHTPGVHDSWSWVGDEASQDLGRHRFTYSIAGHAGSWNDSRTPWLAAELNQPLEVFEVPKHNGALGRTYSLLRLEGNGSVMVNAVKLAENSDEIIIRVKELSGRNADDMSIVFNRPIVSVRVVNGQEEQLQQMTADRFRFNFSLTSYQPKAFAVKLDEMEKPPVSKLVSQPLELPFDLDGISLNSDKDDGDIDGKGNSLAGELLPHELDYNNVHFVFGSTDPGAMNVVSCDGQSLIIPKAPSNTEWTELYLLILATGGPAKGKVVVIEDSKKKYVPVSLFDYTEPIGQWNNRMINGEMVENPAEILPAYINQTPVAWAGTHRHTYEGENESYKFTYLYAERIALSDKSESVTLPKNKNIKLLAASVVVNQHDNIRSVTELYDTSMTAFARIDATQPVFIDGTDISISSPMPNVFLKYTLDGSEPNENSPQFTEPLHLSETTTIKAKAFNMYRDGGVTTSLTVQKLIPIDATETTDPTPGLECRYYEGEWHNLPGFDTLKAVNTITADAVTIPDFARDEDYGLVFKGYVKVPTDGMYEFGISSDDGSILYVADTLLADNDGLHGDGEIAGKVALKAGYHPIEARMFQCKGDEALNLFITGPGIEKQKIPMTMLFH